MENTTRPSRQVVKSIKAKALSERTIPEILADYLITKIGTLTSLFLHFLWYGGWIVINLNLVPGIKPFDPFPFGFLTMLVSLEAIALTLIVLMSQNRESHVNDLREEMDMNVDLIAEAEITKTLEIVRMLAEKNGIDLSQDKDLLRMIQPINSRNIEEKLRKEIVG